MVNIKLLFVITNDGSEKKVKSILNKFGIKEKTVSHCMGTASPSVLDYFGLVETKKNLFLGIIPDYMEFGILDRINDEFNLSNPGGGLAFTVPISSSNKYLSDNFKKSGSKKEIEVMKVAKNKKYHLVITIVLEGYLEDVMNAAKRAGASGGTVIRGRGLGNKDVTKLFGFQVEPGRELVLNIVDEGIKNRVMEEITHDVGIKTPGRGVCLSVPVDHIVGLSE